MTGWRLLHQVHEFCTGHLPQHRRCERIRQAVIVDVHVQSIHDIEVRIGKQFFQRCILDLGRDLVPHEITEVRRRRELLDILKRGRRRYGLFVSMTLSFGRRFQVCDDARLRELRWFGRWCMALT